MEQNNSLEITVWQLLLGGVAVYSIGKIFGELLDDFLYDQQTCKPRIFISHAWKYSEHYNILKYKLESQGFDHYDHSIPEDKQLDATTTWEIKKAITSKIRGCSIVLVTAGMYADRYWMREEIRIAKSLGKRIIAVKPRGAKRIPRYLKDNSIEIIGSYAPKLIKEISCSRY